MYTVCAFVRDWKSGIIVEMNQTAFTEQWRSMRFCPSNIPGSPGVDLRPTRDGKSAGNERFPNTDPFSGA